MSVTLTSLTLGFLPFGGIGSSEMLIFGIIAVLLFGKRLPEVGRSLGKGLVEFKKGVRGIQDEINGATRDDSHNVSSRYNDIDDRDEATAPKFEPPTSEPQADAEPYEESAPQA